MDLDDSLLLDDEAPLLAAVEDGAEERVRELLDHGTSANIHTAEGETALHRASYHGHPNIARLLLERGASTEHVWGDNGTSLHQAAKRGHVSVARVLLQQGAKIDALTARGVTPLYMAAVSGRADVIRFLCEQGSCVDAPTRETWTPLHAACYYNQPAAVEELLRAHADVEWRLRPGSWTPLHKTANRGFSCVAKILLKHGADLDARAGNGWTPLYIAARKGYEDVVRLLLQRAGRHTEIDAQNTLGWSPLHAASYYRRKKIVAMLTKAHPELLEMGIKDAGWTALHMASSLGYSEIVEELIHGGANIEARTRNNDSTPFYIAAREGHVNVLQILIGKGVDIGVRIKGRWTPLHAASYFGRKEALEFLLRSGAPREARMTDGWTALHKAAEAGFTDIVDVLLDYGANIDARDMSRETPLHVAVAHNRADVLRLLLLRGANQEAMNKALMTPMATALTEKHQDCVNVMKDAVANSLHTMWPDGEAEFLTQGRESPQTWLNVIDHINVKISNLIRGASDNVQHRVKIVVLDTGCRTDGAWFNTWTEEASRISDTDHWRDFAANELLPVDEDGHGTAVVTTLLRTARNAEIFVGRVAAKRSDLANCAQNVAEAIKYAMTEWKPDIISMSFGFRTDQPSIKDAISTAVHSRKNKILFFAAAGNRGANEEELYPASSRHVVSVRATDHVGTFVGDYNPAPSPQPMNEMTELYGTLGVNVPYDYPSAKLMSGCSIATPILAGLAALIIQYASYHGAGERSLAYLRQKQGLLWFFQNKGVKQGNKRTYVHLEPILRQDVRDWVNELDALMKKLEQYM
ncbi:Ankyrin-3 [Madurella mycetomatis]|uniref:Ankyrin-3 n=1 Tax=Madurella mycetomatis TaxID=100816 RepID=A0A175WF29_9PEZI|nr:Ankyrin-3 [Madurella mycetomatis]KXX82948.1 Ankyrin-3 [Madurella mycetomatis]